MNIDIGVEYRIFHSMSAPNTRNWATRKQQLM